MESEPRVPVPGSVRTPIPGAEVVGPVDPGERAEVTVVLRRRAPLPAGGRLSRAELAERYGADPGRRRARPVRGRGRRRRGRAGRPGVPADAGRRPGRDAGRAVRAPSCSGSASRTGSWSGSAPARCPCRPGWPTPWSPCSGWTTARRPAPGWSGPPRSSAASPRRSSPTCTRCRPAPTAPAPRWRSSSSAAGSSEADLRAYFASIGVPEPRVRAVGVDGATNAPEGDPSGPTAR